MVDDDVRQQPVGLDDALMLLNDWLGRTVRLLVEIPLGAWDELPPSGPAPGWHIMLLHEGELRRPDIPEEDLARQQTIGTYALGNAKLLLDGMPCRRVVAVSEGEQRPHRLAFYLPGSGSTVVLLLEQLRLVPDYRS